MAIFVKQALAIGNNHYTNISPLNSCVNDAVDVTKSLRSIGFQAEAHANLDHQSMQYATDRFIQSIQPGAIVLFYFSGHGAQLDGYNFLAPTDNDGAVENLKSGAMSAERLIQDIHWRRPRVVIVILDSCRTYIGTQSLIRSPPTDSSFKGSRPGFAPMRVPPGTIVAYACEAERNSSQLSVNNRNSLYTYHLLRFLATPNIDIEHILKNVALEVQRDPLNIAKQIPYRYSSCNEYIYFSLYPRMNQQGAFFPSLKSPYSHQYSQSPSDYSYQNQLNYQYLQAKQHYLANMYARAKMMRYYTGFGYPIVKPLHYRRW